MEHIIDGVLRFQREVYPRRKELFQELARGQSPSVLFIGCSDSRVVPEMVTQQEPGSLFVVRNAGNLVPPHSPEPNGVAASVEYAVKVLAIRDIVICGHSGCGAMSAILRGSDGLEQLPAIAGWLQYADRARDHVLRSHASADEHDRLAALVGENVLVQLENLLTHPPVANALEKRQLRIHGWVYDIGSGAISTYSARAGQFVPIADDPLAHATPVK